MMSEFYQQVFPETRLNSAKPPKQELITTKGGFRYATSVGGVLTGRGAMTIIIDDPMKPSEAVSETQRERVKEWYDHTLLSRLDSKVHGAIVLIMQRLHEDDLTGHVLNQGEEWEHVHFPAIAEEDEKHEYRTRSGPGVFRRKAGDVLMPEREPQEVLDWLKRTMGPYHFAGQYQQAPVPLGGGMVKLDWFRRYTAKDRPETFDRIVQSWDTASKDTEFSDYSVCTTWGIKGQQLFLLDVYRQRLNYPELKKMVRYKWQAWSANVVLIEDKSSGMHLIQELNQEGLGAVTRYEPRGDKLSRVHAQTGIMAEGRIYLPVEAPWLDDYLHELTVFPKGRHDDQVDSTAQFLDWLSTPIKSWGIYEATRRQALGLQAREESYVRLKAPPGLFGSVQTLTGRHATLDDNRTIVVCEEDARHLSPRGWTRIGPAQMPKELRTEPECQYAKGSVEYAAWEEEQKRRSEAAS
ncbi:MAG TPA: phage terminase large subunit [Candidatus Dormibacteraeota bacterium]|nr:phage terminase large subunit [Candidatus Dormibacteraeota bacterium]